MIYKTLFDGTKIPVIGLGTWMVGGGVSPDNSRDDFFVSAIKTALELGYEHIDTAEMYGGGHTEELVGKAVKSFNRKKLFITSKVWPEQLNYKKVIESCEKSLNRLQTDYLDLYLIHYPTASDLGGAFEALNELVAKGKVKYLGVSNFDLADFKKAIKLSKTPLITNQMHYNLLVREPEESGILDYCQKHNTLVTAYQPIERGSVANIPLVQKLAKKYRKTFSQIALNWLISHPSVVTIPKATSRIHLQENLDATEFSIDKSDLAALSKLY